jgi:hypothetical protein
MPKRHNEARSIGGKQHDLAAFCRHFAPARLLLK